MSGPKAPDELSAEERAALALILARKKRERAERATLAPAPRTGELPLSYAQERLWFLDQLAPGGAAYNLPVALRVIGKLDVDVLQATLDELATRHESLRTRFVSEGGRPRQVIDERAEVSLVRGVLEDATKERLAGLVAEEATRPFDLSRGPLLRARVLRLDRAGEQHLLLFTMHHIVSDAWSASVLVGEVGAIYRARLRGERASLAPLPVQYADYAVWQRAWLSGKELERQLSYWSDVLGGAPPVLDLDADRPRPAVQTYRGAAVPVVLPTRLGAAVKALAAKEGATPFMVLLSAFELLMARHSGQRDVVVATAIANRTRREVEGLIGFFVNTLALRMRIEPGDSGRALVAQTKRVTLAAYAHQDLPFEKLVEHLRPERSLSHAPIVQVMFVLQNAPVESLELPGLRFEVQRSEEETARFDLLLELAEGRDGFSGKLSYATDLFDAATARRLVRHFIRLLEGLATQPEVEALGLPMLLPEEQEQLAAWNDTARELPTTHFIHEAFAEQARKTPDAVAVEIEGERLTYAELDARTNQLAHRLRSIGVGPEVLVGICAERSLEMVVGLLGIMKAGGAYVPLDPGYPIERLAYMTSDAAPRVLLTQGRLRDRLPAQGSIVLLLDEDWPKIATEPATALPRCLQPTNLIYMIYTSGSTGRPKGALNSHATVLNRLTWGSAEYPLGPGDAVLQKTPFSFDVSVWEFFWPLMRGARLVLARPEGHRDPSYLVDLIERAGITTLHFVPSMLAVFLDQDRLDRCRSVRQVFCSGEALPLALSQRFFAALPWSRLHNLYGPTEAAVEVTAYTCLPEEPRHTVPIGLPIANARINVVDERFELVPSGVLGELCIAGLPPGRGYHGRPELTAERWVPDPHAGVPGARMYRTGDLVRHLHDGNVEYLGRLDDQVKLRGFRIELGEVEAALAAIDDVNEVVVVARGTAEHKQLVAYLVAPVSLEPATLRTRLSETLPSYMIPAAFVFLDAMPLSPNGKIDRKRLPAPAQARDDVPHVSPRDATEEGVAAIWCDVLSVPQLGVHDNFFTFGGHSLLATQLVSKVRAVLGAELPVRAVFDAPTIAEMAELVRSHVARGTRAEPIPRAPRDRLLPLSFAQERLWFLDQLEPGSSAYNMPAGVRLAGELDEAALRAALDELVRRHEILRTHFVSEGGQPRQVVESVRGLHVDEESLSEEDRGLASVWVAERARAEAARPFDLGKGPLVRARLLRIASDEHVLLFTMHHVVSDGWSMGLLIREVGALYATHVRREPSTLPDVPVQYADYAAWQRGWLRGEVLEAQLAHWRDSLKDAPPLLELPTDRSRASVRDPRGARAPIHLGRELHHGLLALARDANATLYMTVLAAFQVLLRRYSGQRDVVVGSPIANRDRAELEVLLGLFANTIALRIEIRDDESFRALLGRVRAMALLAYANQMVPFEKVVEVLRPERSMSHTPIFQVAFVMQNRQSESLAMQGLALEPLELDAGVAKFDLTLTLAETADGLAGYLEYAEQLFDRATIDRLVESLGRLLAGIVVEPDRPLAALELLGPRDQQSLETWNATFRAPSPVAAQLVCARFKAQAEARPDSVAVGCAGLTLTYRVLDERSNQLAHALRARGVGPEVIVAVFAERSLQMVVGLFAIWKAGGAYLPLDPASPRDRLAYMLSDAGARLVLTDAALLAQLPERMDALCLDRDWPEVERYSRTAPSVTMHEAQLAYVIYTSGSTGRPKGVAIEQRALRQLVAWAERMFDVRPESRAAQLANVSFDASMIEIWPYFACGASVHLVPDATRYDMARLRRWIGTERITHCYVPTPLVEQFLAQWQAHEDAGALEYLLTGGDKLQHAPQAGLDFALVDNYGPTETTCVAVAAVVAPSGGERAPSIGRPLDNVRAYVLDAGLRPVAVGVVGDLYVAGDQVGRGYVGRADLTAERFLPDVAGAPGARMYATGDQVRWLTSGELEYLGRADQQVKIRGFRIELGEVEGALVEQAGVRDAVVVAREDLPGHKRIVAYVTGLVDVDALRTALAQRLPGYMVPDAFVVLEALPLTENGKVDRRALPAPAQPNDEASYVAPHTLTEEKLVAIWAEVLHLDRVGVRDGFFALGGHSLLATQLVSRVRDAMAIDLPLRAVFDAPTVEGMAARVDELVAAGRRSSQSIGRADRSGPLPLSYAQERLWFIDQLDPRSAAYNMPAVLRLSGALDLDALRATLRDLVARHESLRTRFVSEDGVGRQVVDPPEAVPIPVEDLSSLPEALQDARVAERIGREAGEPFDLERGPLFRARLLRLSAERHVLSFTMHHIVSDGWSMGVLVREVGALYAARCAATRADLPELPVQYADYAAWQRSATTTQQIERELAHWRGRLSDAPPLLLLPTDRPRPASQSHRGATLPVVLSPGLSHAVDELARSRGATPFMVLLAAFQLLMSRYSGQKDVVVGTSIANRTHKELEGLIGFFVSTLIMRAELKAELSGAALIDQVKETALSAYANQTLPVEKLLEELRPERTLSHSPVFQVTFILQNVPMTALELPGLRIVAEEPDARSAKFDLALDLGESPRGYEGSLVYATELFDECTVAQMMRHYAALLGALTRTPTVPIGDLAMLAPDDERQLLAFGTTPGPSETGALLPATILAQARRTPEAVAVSSGGASWTYAELDARSGALARHLRNIGIGPDSVVGLCLSRSFDLIVGVLGIWRAGAAYLPLDPAYPRDRLALMLADAAPRVVVSHGVLADVLPPGSFDVVRLESVGEDRHDGEAALPTLAPDHLAYVIYTSGSSGTPKGVAITHRGVVNHARAVTRSFGLTAADRVLQFHSISFDAAVEEIFPTLACGATLVLRPEELPAPGEDLHRLIRAEGLTVLDLPTMYWAEWVNALGPTPALGPLRLVVVGGERVAGPTLARWWDAVGSRVRWINTYGPTEATVIASEYALEGAPPAEVPIGRPIDNARIYILDDALRSVAPGVVGDLYLGGPGLARGYLRRPELTASVFVPSPFEAGARLYRTGDRGRWSPDGSLHFAGRVDHQVKVRGFRVELGEIEAALKGTPGAAEVAVIAREDVHLEQRVVAYVTGAASVDDLRRALAAKLPAYMLPSAIVRLDALPLTANGKLDHRRLPSPEQGSDESYVAPRNVLEANLAEIWRALLRLPRVGVRDNFFEIGGHSLLATQLISKIRAELHAALPLRTVFDAPTIEGLSERLQALDPASREAPLEEIPRVERGGSLALSFAQERLWFLDQLDPGNTAYNMPVVLRLRGPLDVAALAAALRDLASRHEALRTRFVSDDGVGGQRIDVELELELVTEDLAALPSDVRDARRAARTSAELAEPFDLSRGPLARARLLRLAAEDHLLLFSMHHIVSDAWSMGVLVREVSAFYAARSAGGEAEMPALPVQYADFASWQRERLAGEGLAQQVAYWRAHLAGAPALSTVPSDRARPAAQSHRGAEVPIAISRTLSTELDAFARREGATPFMVLLGVFQLLLARYAGQRDVVVGTVLAGRTRRELESLIGFFVNTLALRATLSHTTTGVELVAQAKEVTLGAHLHQDLPFERLVEALRPERTLSHAPLFQTMFVFQNAPVEALTLGGLSLLVEEAKATTAKFDLTLELTESADGYGGRLSYATDLYDEQTAVQFGSNFARLLDGLVSRPHGRVLELPMHAEEDALLLARWNDTTVVRPDVGPVSERIAAQAARTPGALAVVDHAHARLTYAELDARANRLAHRLRRSGVGPDVLVGLYLERSSEMVVALLAVWRAGGAYLPLDPGYPAERVGYMLSDAGVHLLITEERVLARLGAFAGEALCLDRDAPAIAAEPATAPIVRVHADHLAYVIYTSGSTGTPKGAAIPHRALANHMSWMDAAYPLTASDRVLQKTPFSFDASVWEFWAPLLAGATLVVAAPELHRDVTALAGVLEDESITILQLVPTMLGALVEEPQFWRNRLRRLFVGGEALPQALASEVQRRSGIEVVNLYGPTEACIDTLSMRARTDDQRTTVPIGRPIDNVTAHVLDDRLAPTAIGITGELYIGGAALARGYLGRPDLTADRFVPSPFQAGERLYRTGDVVRRLPAGVVEYVGRADAQVKLRGYRIELGEIEAVLREQPGIDGVAVVVRTDAAGAQRLVAYLAGTADVGELRTALARRLTDYMVPSVFVPLERLPLTPSGKLDRGALPAPVFDRDASGYVAPSTELEAKLVAIWQDVLKLERIGVQDNFFELGGDSFLIIQIVSRARRAGLELTPRQLFEHPRIEALARTLGVPRERRAVPRLDAHSTYGRIPLSQHQRRTWRALHDGKTDASIFNLPQLVELPAACDLGLLRRCFDEVVARHAILRATFHEPGPYQVIVPDMRPSFVSVMLEGGHDDYDEVDRQVRAWSQPFDVERGPLVRVVTWTMPSGRIHLLLVVHHIVADGWSIELMKRELALLYDAFSRGRPSPLAPLELQYTDYAIWQDESLTPAFVEQQQRRWVKKLEGFEPHPIGSLRTPHPDEPGQIGVTLGHDAWPTVRDFLQRHNLTVFGLMAAAEALVLWRESGATDHVIGFPLLTRVDPRLEDLVGYFINHLFLRVQIDERSSLLAFIVATQAQAAEAYADQDVSLDTVLSDAQRPLLYKYRLNIVPVADVEPAGPRLAAPPRPVAALPGPKLVTQSPFDLSFYIATSTEELSVALRYRVSLFEPRKAQAILGSLIEIVSKIIQDPNQPIAVLRPTQR